MTFIVPGDRSFAIIPKHSNLPLAPVHHQRHPGNAIQQQEPYKNNPAQQFQLQKNGRGEYHVYLPFDNLHWAIAGVSPNVGADLIQWHMQDRDGQNSPNQRFRFMHAGNGYYYLRPVHSGRVLEVPNATRGQDTIKQGTLAPANNRDFQLFRVVPSSPDYVANEAHTFHQYSDLVRDAVLGVIGAIPKVGGAVKGVLGVLWPDGHDKDFWNQTTLYVEQRVKELLKEEKLKNLRSDLQGARTNADEYLDTYDLENQRTKLIAAISAATQREDNFLREQEGVEILSLLAAWGTLVMTLRADMVKEFVRLHPAVTDPQEQEKGKASELKHLRAAIKRYGEAVQRSREAAMAWRLSKIRHDFKGDREYVDLGNGRMSIVDWRKDWVTDSYDGWRMERGYRRPNSNPGDPDCEANIAHAFRARKAQVQAQFGAELDAMLAAAYLWPYFDPTKTEKPSAQKITAEVGPFGGRPGGTTFGAGTGGLKKIVICSDAGQAHVCGLQLTYADGVEHTYGKKGNQQAALTLADGEYVANARGYEWDRVHGLMLETNHGHLIEGGQLGHHSFFEAGLDDAVNAQLVGISGTHTADALNTLTFHWQYTLQK
ncbi:RICIN domain-containing protein [Hymenobacter jeollabukensis]|uniref:Jacalin-type lectin domain-containing protein n=1 Tax=Hymenobacter jeollabukensis TaxID=2025313 RepID=A0A5R8WKH8_9BACT|nr:RICIN domain-containing protein [Hymenobacter jeollabukensis]TLM89438.1 hypothetical protein FDY95_20405 [Hymenobacter jeollabukensis]